MLVKSEHVRKVREVDKNSRSLFLALIDDQEEQPASAGLPARKRMMNKHLNK